MEIKRIIKEEIESISKFAAKQFINDDFYKGLCKKNENIFAFLTSIFEKSIAICIDYGIAIKVVNDDQDLAFLLAFDYFRLKQEHPSSFNHFFSVEKNEIFTSKLHEERIFMEQYMCNKNYMYILSIGVDEDYRNQGVASSVIQKFCDVYDDYSFITDISNAMSVGIYRKLGFNILDTISGCIIVQKDAKQIRYPDLENIYLIIPKEYIIEDVDVYIDDYLLDGYNIYANIPCFYRDLSKCSKTRIVKLSKRESLGFQSKYQVTLLTEKSITVNNKECILYIIDNHEKRNWVNEFEVKQFNKQLREDNLIVDAITSFPIIYEDEGIFEEITNFSYRNANNILSAMQFRTEYESGVPIESDDRGYKSRLKRFYLGRVQFQLKHELELSFQKGIISGENIGNMVDGFLILSIDTKSNIGVLHLITLSFSELITQYLDCVSRNQLIVIDGDDEVNFYKYIEDKFSLKKAGVAKNFLTAFEDVSDISKDLLASILFCETYYTPGESLGNVVDNEIFSMINKSNGVSQYDYANVYMDKTIVFQTSNNNLMSIEDRIIYESVTLFYIELILFEEAAITYMDDSINKYLSNIDKKTPTNTLKTYGQILNNYAMTIEFWDIKMNYPSSKKSIINIRKYFDVDLLLKINSKNQEIFRQIYNIRSDYLDKIESTILTMIGAVITTMSMIGIITDSTNYKYIALGGIVVGILLFLKYLYMRLVFKRRK